MGFLDLLLMSFFLCTFIFMCCVLGECLSSVLHFTDLYVSFVSQLLIYHNLLFNKISLKFWIWFLLLFLWGSKVFLFKGFFFPVWSFNFVLFGYIDLHFFEDGVLMQCILLCSKCKLSEWVACWGSSLS